jgi:hypothetical protein
MRVNTETGENYLTLDLIRLILLNQLCLDPDRIIIYNQKFILPPSKGLQIYIEPKAPPTAISVRTKMEYDAYYDPSEHQDSNWLEEISVGIYSRDLSALRRKEEVAMSLHSVYSQQLQEAQSFKIFRNPRIIPINEIEGAARLYRFDIEFRVQAWYSVVKTIEFFNSLNVEVRVNDGQPDMVRDFAIPTPEYLTDPSGIVLLDPWGNPITAGDELWQRQNFKP